MKISNLLVVCSIFLFTSALKSVQAPQYYDFAQSYQPRGNHHETLDLRYNIERLERANSDMRATIEDANRFLKVQTEFVGGLIGVGVIILGAMCFGGCVALVKDFSRRVKVRYDGTKYRHFRKNFRQQEMDG